MTILHAHSALRFAAHLRSVLAAANGHPHSVDIAVGYFYLTGGINDHLDAAHLWHRQRAGAGKPRPSGAGGGEIRVSGCSEPERLRPRR